MYEYYQRATYCYLTLGSPCYLLNEGLISSLISKSKNIFTDCNTHLAVPLTDDEITNTLPLTFCASLWRVWAPNNQEYPPATQLIICWFQDERSSEIPEKVMQEIKRCDWYHLSTAFEW